MEGPSYGNVSQSKVISRLRRCYASHEQSYAFQLRTTNKMTSKSKWATPRVGHAAAKLVWLFHSKAMRAAAH